MIVILPSGDPTYGLSLAQMIDEVAGQLRNNKVEDKITSWLNLTMYDLAANYEFPFLHASSELQLQPGVRSYLLEPNLLWLKLAFFQGIHTPLFPATEDELQAADPFFLTQPGQVLRYVLHDRAFDVWRIPGSIQTINYFYQRRPTKLMSTSDQPDFPYEWHQLLIQGAKVRGYEYERNPLLKEAIQEYTYMKKERVKNIYHRTDFPMVLKSNNALYGRPGRPTLPSNYPRV